MMNLSEHFLILDPIPHESDGVDWKAVTKRIARIFLIGTSRIEVYRTANTLTESIQYGRPLPEPLRGKVNAVLHQDIPYMDAAKRQFVARICSMMAILYVLANRQWGEMNASRRDAIAVALWSSLGLRDQLMEPRLEYLRGAILATAQRVALQMAAADRSDEDSTSVGSTTLATAQTTIDALQHRVRLVREENSILRWLLSNRSEILAIPMSHIEPSEMVAMIKCLELGMLLREFPTHDHYIFITDNVDRNIPVSLSSLLNVMGDYRDRLAKCHQNNIALTQCPLVFPFLRAVNGDNIAERERLVERPLADWCGRALLEVSAIRYADSDRETGS